MVSSLLVIAMPKCQSQASDRHFDTASIAHPERSPSQFWFVVTPRVVLQVPNLWPTFDRDRQRPCERSQTRSGLPSGNHLGVTSTDASEVNRVTRPRSVSSSQISVFPFNVRCSATRRPSGESDGFKAAPIGSPTLLSWDRQKGRPNSSHAREE